MTFVNVPSFVIAENLPVRTPRGEVLVTTAFGGAVYACVDVADLGLSVVPEHLDELIAIGRGIKWDLNESDAAKHPEDERLSGIYGTIVYEKLGTDESGRLHQRNVTIFADGEVDRSPCGRARRPEWRRCSPTDLWARDRHFGTRPLSGPSSSPE